MNLRLLCLTTASDKAAVEEILTDRVGWGHSRRWVDTLVVSSEYASSAEKLQTHVKTILRTEPSVALVAAIGAGCPYSYLNLAGVAFQKFSSAQEFRRGAAVFLRNNRLDAASYVVSEVAAKYGRTPLTFERIDRWVDQFQKFGQFDWVARGLLSNLTVLSTSDLVDRLVPNRLHALNYEAVCFEFDDNEDVSSGRTLQEAIAFEFRDKAENLRPNLERAEIGISRAANGASLILEDCAISGYEFRSLMDKYWPESTSGADPARLHRLVFRYAAISNGVEFVLPNLARDRGLQNVRFEFEDSYVVNAFSTQGLEALRNGKFYGDDGTPRFLTYLHPGVFEPSNNLDNNRAKTAKRICFKIGGQAYNSWHSRKYGNKSRMPEEKKKLAGLGVGGHALALVLGKHVPKSSLPVFWCNGEVRPVRQTAFEWMPLFA